LTLSAALLQHRKRQIVARAYREQLIAFVAGIRQHATQIRSERLDMRLHARAGPPLGPQQALGNCVGRAFCPCDQVISGSRGPSPTCAANPHVAIGRAERLRRMTDRAAFNHGGQQFKERVA
jgi:hypothetical protein